MNNTGVKTTDEKDNQSTSFGQKNGKTDNSFLNQNPPLIPLSKPIKVPLQKEGFKSESNPAFNPSYISHVLGINGTLAKAQHNKPIYQPIIYQPYVMPVMNNIPNMGMNQYGMMPQYPGMMMGGYPQMPQYPGMMMGGYPQMPQYLGMMMGGYPQMPQYLGMMMGGYPQMPQYLGMMMGYPPLAGPDPGQQYQETPQYVPNGVDQSVQNQHDNYNNNHFAIMNPDLMKHNLKDEDDFAGFATADSDFDENLQNINNNDVAFDSDFDDNFQNINNNDTAFDSDFDNDTSPFSNEIGDVDNNDFNMPSFEDPDLNQNNGLNTHDNDFGAGSDFKMENNFDQLNPPFEPTNNFNDQGSPSFGPTPDFNAAPGFNSPVDFNAPLEFDSNGVNLGSIDPVKMPFAQNNDFNQPMNSPELDRYGEESQKRRLPIWAIVLIVILVVLIVAVVTIVMLYFNLEAVHNLINGWFGLDVPFSPWF
ncbi:hypothetical protein [Spiroplasma endosymbiont of Stenodema calcarata]|uniref:hypothetical protein n=1 Tax=Spiroplasma endosymbiont of Stenodema calcarata TaxID=3139328 RepID=UPI003CCB6498